LTGDRKIETVPLKEVQPLTSYVRGGVTVLGAKKAPSVYVDGCGVRVGRDAWVGRCWFPLRTT